MLVLLTNTSSAELRVRVKHSAGEPTLAVTRSNPATASSGKQSGVVSNAILDSCCSRSRKPVQPARVPSKVQPTSSAAFSST